LYDCVYAIPLKRLPLQKLPALNKLLIALHFIQNPTGILQHGYLPILPVSWAMLPLI
jgi:hypothetical protein